MANHILVRQASHGQRVAQAHYAVDGAFLHRLGPQLISAFEQASVAWHQLFQWPSVGASRTKVEGETAIKEGRVPGKAGRLVSQQLQPSIAKRTRDIKAKRELEGEPEEELEEALEGAPEEEGSTKTQAFQGL